MHPCPLRSTLRIGTDDLHVLLRHRLLRQTDGFEGLLWFTEGAKAKHLSISELQHPARGRFALDSAALSAVVDPTDQYDGVAPLRARRPRQLARSQRHR